eukprot:963336_1
MVTNTSIANSVRQIQRFYVSKMPPKHLDKKLPSGSTEDLDIDGSDHSDGRRRSECGDHFERSGRRLWSWQGSEARDLVRRFGAGSYCVGARFHLVPQIPMWNSAIFGESCGWLRVSPNSVWKIVSRTPLPVQLPSVGDSPRYRQLSDEDEDSHDMLPEFSESSECVFMKVPAEKGGAGATGECFTQAGKAGVIAPIKEMQTNWCLVEYGLITIKFGTSCL